jgi:hypothetical protein
MSLLEGTADATASGDVRFSSAIDGQVVSEKGMDGLQLPLLPILVFPGHF